MEAWLQQYPVASILIGLGLSVVIGFIGYLFSRMLLQGVSQAAGARPPLITAMSLLGILGTIGLIGALFTSQESAYTIAATVVGGLTGYLTAQAQQNKVDEQAAWGAEGDLPSIEETFEEPPPGDVRNPLPPLLVEPGDEDDDDA